MFIDLGEKKTCKISHLRALLLGKCLAYFDNLSCYSAHDLILAHLLISGKEALKLLTHIC